MDSTVIDIEKIWWEAFGDSYGIEFEKARPDYHTLDKTTQIVGALMKLELDMYNGGYLQFFCNWGYSAYLLALEGLESINASKAKSILEKSYAIIEKYEDDDRIQQLWDIPAVLSEEESEELDQLDQMYWEDEDSIMEKMLDTYSKG